MITIDVWVNAHKTEFFKDVEKLVAIPSISQKGKDNMPFGKACADVLDVALSMEKEYGMETSNHAYYCGEGRIEGEDPKLQSIGVFSHLDVVPVGNGWEYPPFACTEKDGYLIGRGVSDNKGPAVSVMYAFRYLKEQGIRLRHPIVHYLGCSEETGMEDVEYYKKHCVVPQFGLVADCSYPVCYGEKGILRMTFRHKTGGQIVSMQAGTVINSIPDNAEARLKGTYACPQIYEKDVNCQQTEDDVSVKAKGKSAHAAFPEGSVNAINILCGALASLPLDDEDRRLVQNISTLSSTTDGSSLGIAMSDAPSGPLTAVATLLHMIDGMVEMSFDIRYPVTAKGGDISTTMEERMEKNGWMLQDKNDSAPCYTPKDSAVIRELCKIANDSYGPGLEPYTMGGGTYARNLPFAVGFGPGIPDAPRLFPKGRGDAHQNDETMQMDVLLKGIKTYVQALIVLDGLFDAKNNNKE